MQQGTPTERTVPFPARCDPITLARHQQLARQFIQLARQDGRAAGDWLRRLGPPARRASRGCCSTSSPRSAPPQAITKEMSHHDRHTRPCPRLCPLVQRGGQGTGAAVTPPARSDPAELAGGLGSACRP